MLYDAPVIAPPIHMIFLLDLQHVGRVMTPLRSIHCGFDSS